MTIKPAVRHVLLCDDWRFHARPQTCGHVLPHFGGRMPVRRQYKTGGDFHMMRDLFYGVSEQGKAGKHRMDDARALLNAVRWRGAMYMAGYSVECLLKTKLMRMFNCRHLRELEEELQGKGILAAQATIFTHQLELLLRLTNAIERLRRNEEHWRLFNMVNRWVPAWRYTADLSNPDDAKDFVDAIEKVSHWIENNI